MRTIIQYTVRKIAGLIPVLFIVSFLAFTLMKLAPGNPAEIILTSQGSVINQELIDDTIEEMGLNEPFFKQYVNWASGILKGDFGNSYSTGRKVSIEIKEHLPYTVILAGVSMAMTLVISIPLGIISGIKRNKTMDYFVRALSFAGNSIPGFFLALILLMIFSLKLKLVPILSDNGIKSVILPSVTLATAMSSKYIRQIRAVVIEELEKDYIKGARARGVRENVVIYKNLIKNIMITIITLTGLSLGSLIGGTAVIESIFVWPGIGRLVLSAISNRDYPLIQAYVLLMAVIFIGINLISDFLYRLFDPRVKA